MNYHTLKGLRGLLLIFVLCLSAGQCCAHTMAPVLINVVQTNLSELKVVWSVTLDNRAINPASLSLMTTPECILSSSNLVEGSDSRRTWQEQYLCKPPSAVQQIKVMGLQQAGTTAAIRVRNIAGVESIQMLDEKSSTFNVSNEASSRRSVLQYVDLGVQHILSGADHLLFVVLLCFLSGGVIGTLIGLISAFTVAHSITLSAAAMGWVSLPVRPVEALIALSIALAAADLMQQSRQSSRRIIDYWPVVFVFGLLHGLGFAGALSDLGLPQDDLFKALLAFNAGVEIGQLGVVLVCALLIQLLHRFRQPGWLDNTVGMGIGCTSGFWFVTRLF